MYFYLFYFPLEIDSDYKVAAKYVKAEKKGERYARKSYIY